MTALGTIVEAERTQFGETEIYCGLLDYYDHWESIDPRLAPHHARLSNAAEVFGHDLVNMATYAHEILEWLSPQRIRMGQSVVSVAGMAEAFLVSARSASDAVGDALSYLACASPGQAPSGSLRSLIAWSKKNPSRVNPPISAVLSGNLEWFWNLRSLRDFLVHKGAHANIHCDGRQFNLWIHSAQAGWITREPLMPLLASKLCGLLALGGAAASAINSLVAMPPDRVRSRVVSGILIPALHKLTATADQYAQPSP